MIDWILIHVSSHMYTKIIGNNLKSHDLNLA
jgi:hypothetical protein